MSDRRTAVPTTPDLEIAERFYGKLFGWTFYADPNDAGYVTVYLRDYLIGGIVKPSNADNAQHQSAWLAYVAVGDVGDVDAVSKVALAQGGKILAAPRSYATRGRQAVLGIRTATIER